MNESLERLNRKKISVPALAIIISSAVIVLLCLTLWVSVTESIEDREKIGALYAHMVSESITRTIESVETSLISLSEDLYFPNVATVNLQSLTLSFQKVLKFAPHIRQLVLIQNEHIILDSYGRKSGQIDIDKLGLHKLSTQVFSPGFGIGKQVESRFLPLKENSEVSSSKRVLIPLAYTFTTPNQQTYTLIAAINPAYIRNLFYELTLYYDDHIGLYDFSGHILVSRSENPYQRETSDAIKFLANEGKDSTQLDIRNDMLSLGQNIAIRLLDKYPLAIVVSLNHQRSFILWIENNIFLISALIIAASLIIISAVIIIIDYSTMHSLQKKISVLSTAVDQSSVSVLITNTEGEIEYANKQFEKSTGYRLETILGSNPRFLKSGRDSNEKYRSLWESISKGEIWQGELNNRTREGTVYCSKVHIAPVSDQDGNITNYIAVAEDITQQKQNERQLRLAAAVFENATEAIIVTDQDNRIQAINNAFQQITGFDRAFAIGKNPSIMQSGLHDKQFYKNMFSTLKKHGRWEGEITNRRQNGEIYTEWLNIFTLLDENQKLDGYAAMFKDITEHKKNEAYIIHQANYDSLTGLVNRHLFNDRLSNIIDRAARYNERVAVLFIDLDHFKYVNDTLGHSIGDLLLQEVARRLDHNIRKTDTVARFGGDEFAIILQEINNINSLENLTNKLLKNLSQSYLLNGVETFVSASIGITMYPEDGETPEILIQNADSAMYRAKAKGRNDYQFFTQRMRDDISRHKEMENALYLALQNEEFSLSYQPIKNLLSGQYSHAEALIRWNHADKGIINPCDFIPVAEEIGLISQIGEWVLIKACQDAVEWSSKLQSPPDVSVNLSAHQFYRNDIVQYIKSILLKTGLPASRLTLEITESLMLTDFKSVCKQLNQLRELGVGISLDDFGTGYSSLSYLKKIPLNKLKIDRSFIADIATDADDRTLVTAIIAMAQSLNIEVVAEGVETLEQEAFIKSLNCHYAQGFLYSTPLPIKQFMEFLHAASAA